jgi:hypothetical protein
MFAVHADQFVDERLFGAQAEFFQRAVEDVSARTGVKERFGVVEEAGALAVLHEPSIDSAKAAENVLPLGKEGVVEVEDNDAPHTPASLKTAAS